MVIYWPHGRIDPEEEHVLDQIHGKSWAPVFYQLKDSEHPLGIVRKIKDNPGALVYVACTSQAVVACAHKLQFGLVEYTSEGVCAVYHFDPASALSQQLQMVWSRSAASEEEPEFDLDSMGITPDKATLN